MLVLNEPSCHHFRALDPSNGLHEPERVSIHVGNIARAPRFR